LLLLLSPKEGVSYHDTIVKKTLVSNSQPAPSPASQEPRILYLGTPGDFSVPPLLALLNAGLPVCAVVVPAAPSSKPVIRHAPVSVGRAQLPILSPFMNRTIAQIAWDQHIPVVEVGALSHAGTRAALEAFQPDVICVACFPRRLPKELLVLPPLGCLNAHPSLLPAYRGPSPGFWALRNGERATGVTIHLMDEQLDTGDILLQQTIDIPEGISSAALEQECSIAGAPLLVQAVRALAVGTASRTPQPVEGSSYYSWPRDEDFSVPVTRPARWAFNFICGLADWGRLPELRIGAERFPVRQALDYQPDARLRQPYRREGDELWAQCAPGVLHVLLN
jgi:methionyl-tRNA formyltransferase